MKIESIFEYIDEHKAEYIEQLQHWVSYKTVSAYPECRKVCTDFIGIVKKELEALDAKVTVVPNPAGMQKYSSGQFVEYPPFILAEIIKDPSKKTVCIYGHLDVQPAEITDGWATDPFKLSIKDGFMFGRGTTDDKGPVVGWLCVLKIIKELKLELDLNLKFVFESMEESGSQGMSELIKAEKNNFFKDVDWICISDNSWIGTETPCITYGLRGIMYYFIEVTGPKYDIHSGVHGGAIHEPMTDLISIMNGLVNNKGVILIPHVCDEISSLTEEETDLYRKINFNAESYSKSIGCQTEHLLYSSKEDILMHRWRYPSLSMHGIEGAFYSSGEKTVIPSKVIGKFSIRTVPNMTISYVNKCVEAHIEKLAKDLNSPNTITVKLSHGAPAWVSDYHNINYISAIKATELVYGVTPNLTREGGSIPIALEFESILEKNVMLLPMGRGDGGQHSQEENLNINNFLNGIKLFYAYLKEISQSE